MGTPYVIEPGSTLGVLGGGQLGAMFAVAARRMGYRVAVWDPDPQAPALERADVAVAAGFEDDAARRRFTASIQGATYEWENVPLATCREVERSVPLRPGSEILRLLQNRLIQKRFFSERAIPVTPFRAVSSPAELSVASELGYPCLCKTATTGYDGKGQWRLRSEDDARRLRAEWHARSPAGGAWILERWMPFEKELSVLVVRSERDQVRTYPTVENVHEGGILRFTRAPADLPASLADRALTLARSAVEALDGIGVFCVEMFLLPGGELIVNEVAPRPHNSGHYTLDACTVSQFEQQVRALCGLPLGEARLLAHAVMVNLIGADLDQVLAVDRLAQLLAVPGAALHVYGKKASRPGRKMGHVTFVAEKGETAWEAARALRDALGPRGETG